MGESEASEPKHDRAEILAESRHILVVLRNKLVAGILVAIPLVVTVWVLNLAYRFIKGISDPWLRQIPGLNLNQIPGVSFIVTLLLILFLGFMATNVLGRKILDHIEHFLMKVPLVATVYAGVKQVIESFKTFNTDSGFKRVVYVEYPSEGTRLIGFVTGQFYDAMTFQEVTTVFLPTAPNPMTGFVLVVPSHKVIESSLTVEEASKLIVSGGLVVPRKGVGSFTSTSL